MVQVLPDDWEVMDIKGQNLEALEKYKAAEQAYRKDLELNPQNAGWKATIEGCEQHQKKQKGEFTRTKKSATSDPGRVGRKVGYIGPDHPAD